MPKPKAKGATGPSLWLGVSPWHDKATDRERAPAEGAEQGYHVVELDLIADQAHQAAPSGPEAVSGGACASGQPAAVAPAAVVPAAQAAGTGPAGGSPPAPVGSWRVKKRKAGGPEEAQQAVPSAHIALAGEGGSAEAEAPPAAVVDRLEGTAVLAVLPNNSITGHFLPLGGGRRRSIGLMGEEVLAYRDCTRDAEWRVLRMTAIDFAGGARESCFLVERTEGDAMRLRAPIAWQGQEVETQEQLSQGCQAGIELEFDCQQLLVDAAAKAELRRLQPSLCGRGAMVNVGTLKLIWPRQEAVQGQVPRPAPGLLEAQAPPPGGAQLPAPQQPAAWSGPQHTLGSLTGGPASGRTVKDSEELW